MKSMYLTPTLYNKLYSFMTYDNVLVMRLSLETGMRVGDVVALRRCNFYKRTIKYIAEKTGKRDSKAISQGLYLLLMKNFRTDKPNEYLFKHRTKKGEHRTRQAVWKNVKKACKQIGLDINVTPHSARKSYAVELFNDKGLTVTQKELQHDNLSTTMLYAFADMLQDDKQKNSGDIDVYKFADIVANKVADIVVDRLLKVLC